VLLATGIKPIGAIGAVRLSHGRPATFGEIERAAHDLAIIARGLRAGTTLDANSCVRTRA
jgi:hypothetical protein